MLRGCLPHKQLAPTLRLAMQASLLKAGGRSFCLSQTSARCPLSRGPTSAGLQRGEINPSQPTRLCSGEPVRQTSMLRGYLLLPVHAY